MDIAFMIFIVFGAGCLCLFKKFMFTKDETSILSDILYDKGNLDEENKHRFVELDQEIAEKEKELNSLKELQKKEKKLNDLNNQIEQYSDVSKTLSNLGSTMEQIGQPLYNAEYGHIPIYISESNTNNKFFNNALTSNGGIDLSKYDKNVIMSAEEIREKQKNTHWSEDKKLLKVYEESKQKALKEIEQLIQETIVGNKNKVIYTMERMYILTSGVSMEDNLALFNLTSNEYVLAAKTEFLEDIKKVLNDLGYLVQHRENMWTNDIIVEW